MCPPEIVLKYGAIGEQPMIDDAAVERDREMLLRSYQLMRMMLVKKGLL
jgi:hypothetical protein